MINLLPDDAKKETIAARSNVVLTLYIVILALGVAFLAFISAGVYVVLVSTQAAAEQRIADNSTKTNSFSAIKAQADGLRASLSNAKTLLDKEVAYSKVVTGIATVVPTGVVIDSLTLSPATFTGPVTLQVYAKTTEDALRFKDNLSRSILFGNPSFVSLSNTAGAQASNYPVSATLTVTINKGAAK